MDWKAWHERYDDPASDFSKRLATVRDRIRDALDQAPAGPLRAISLCAGQGRDLIPLLAEHPRGRDVRARLVELDADNTAFARALVAEAGLDHVEVVTGDASLTDHYLDLSPADLVLICGVYGNLRMPDIENTVAACAALVKTGGTVVWTRGRRPELDAVPNICAWYERHGFEQLWLEDPSVQMCVGAHRHTGPAVPLEPGVSLFEFIGYDVLYPRPA
ncbi:MAG TPA: class I SAM-dependent methyltransferase [Actinospica sp.]|nr:class I SAM-dependent methyltransferase [Actinospica sp.]